MSSITDYTKTLYCFIARNHQVVEDSHSSHDVVCLGTNLPGTTEIDIRGIGSISLGELREIVYFRTPEQRRKTFMPTTERGVVLDMETGQRITA